MAGDVKTATDGQIAIVPSGLASVFWMTGNRGQKLWVDCLAMVMTDITEHCNHVLCKWFQYYMKMGAPK